MLTLVDEIRIDMQARREVAQRLRLAGKHDLAKSVERGISFHDIDDQINERAAYLKTQKSCDHAQWNFKDHGRVCPCGTFMVDWGD